MKKRLIIILLIGIIAYAIKSCCDFDFKEIDSECGLSLGPCSVMEIERLFLDNEEEYDTTLITPKGEFSFSHLHDSFPARIYFRNTEGINNWGVELKGGGQCDVSFNVLSNLSFEAGKMPIISFYNQSYGEPGKVYLKEDYSFGYLCQSPF